ncbi:MAG: hypothetical protein WAK13_11760 [Terriglobales bacterium]
MKTLGLWFLFCICIASLGYAQQAKVETLAAAKVTPTDSDWIAAPVASGAGDRLILNLNSDQANSSDNYCAYMRTYRVKRRWRGSDAVGPAGYTTCVPMRRFDVHSAVETRSETRSDSGGPRE